MAEQLAPIYGHLTHSRTELCYSLSRLNSKVDLELPVVTKWVRFFGLQDGYTQEQPTGILANEKMTNPGTVRDGSGSPRLQ